jgi:ketosteroid isomerase-like protein
VLCTLTFQFLISQEPAICIEMTPPEKCCDSSCELMLADQAFNARAQEVGVPQAFVEFAADDAVMYRNGSEPIMGKDAIAKLLAGEENTSLVWEPITCDIADSGDLGYTRGSFTMHTAPTPDGQPGQGPYKGYYVSIWKKQKDGTWKWVFDSGVISQIPAQGNQ